MTISTGHEGSGGAIRKAPFTTGPTCVAFKEQSDFFTFRIYRIRERNLWRHPRQSLLCGYRVFGIDVSHEGSGGTSRKDRVGHFTRVLYGFSLSLVRAHQQNLRGDPFLLLLIILQFVVV